MADVKNANAPWLGGWMIAAGMGLVAFGVSKVLGGFDYTPAVVIGAVVALVAGLVMGMPWGQTAAAADHAAPAATPAAPAAAAAPAPAPAAAPTPAPAAAAGPAPVAAAPASLISAPQAPAEAAPVAASSATDGPVRLSSARGGRADDLKQIEGIGPAMERMLNGLGFWHFDQIAGWSEADVALVDGELKGFKGRITRDKWVAQARIIVSEGLDAFRKRAETNDY